MANFNSKKSIMQLNVLSYTSFLFLMVILFSSLAFAPWTKNNPPESPRHGIRMTCAQWIVYHGFTEDDYEENRRLSMDRSYKLDKNASTWAAIYAFKIGGIETPPRLLPADFCNTFGGVNMFIYPYIALKEEVRSCDGWISLYRMSHDDLTSNIEYARNQDIRKMEEISIWAYSYFSHLRRWGDRYALSPQEFCTSIGKKVGVGAKFMPFINVIEPHLTCTAWIHLYEYTDDLNYNYNKVLLRELQYSNYNTEIHYFPETYRMHLRSQGLHGHNRTPMEYCMLMRFNETVFFPFHFSHINTRTRPRTRTY